MYVVLQRYLLTASDAPAGFVVAANATAQGSVVSPVIPLSGSWTIRLKPISGFVQPQDTSGSIIAQSCRCFWTFLGPSNVVLGGVDGVSSIVSPNFTLPIAGFGVAQLGVIDQVISNLDQIGGVIIGVQANVTWILHNSDAANPHTVTISMNAILEFDSAGAT